MAVNKKSKVTRPVEVQKRVPCTTQELSDAFVLDDLWAGGGYFRCADGEIAIERVRWDAERLAAERDL